MSDNTETAGGTRYSQGKPKFYHFPALGLKEIARVAENGGDKYAPFDYRLGQSFSTLINSASRHWIDLIAEGPQSRDEESGHLNAAHLAWNLIVICQFIEEGRADELDDITPIMNMNTEEYRRYLQEKENANG